MYKYICIYFIILYYITSLDSNGNKAPIDPKDVPNTITSLAVDTNAAFYNVVINSP